MDYTDFEVALSQPRLGRFLVAAKGKHQQAIDLYKLNIELSKSLFGVLGIFEVVLRNQIDQYYRNLFADKEWLKNQCGLKGMFSHPSFSRRGFETRTRILTTIAQLGKHFTHDRLVAELNFGFWNYMFAPIQFRVGGQGLHKIYVKRPKGTSQSHIFNELDELRNLRNRIAHHEPLCFNKSHLIDTIHTQTTHSYILKHVEWLGYEIDELFLGMDDTTAILTQMSAYR